MAISLTSPVTGSAQTGFTSPTYTVTEDVPPDSNAIQHAVSALGGTQTGVTSHSVSSPFTCTFKRPKNLRTLGMPNANGLYSRVPMNEYQLLTRKGVTPAEGMPDRVGMIRTVFSVPAGAEGYDPAEIRAMVSAHLGYLEQQSANIGDVLIEGLL